MLSATVSKVKPAGTEKSWRGSSTSRSAPATESLAKDDMRLKQTGDNKAPFMAGEWKTKNVAVIETASKRILINRAKGLAGSPTETAAPHHRSGAPHLREIEIHNKLPRSICPPNANHWDP